MPSISTRVWLASAPRMRNWVKPPPLPVRVTPTPGILRSASAALRTCCCFSSSPVTTETAVPRSWIGMPPAVGFSDAAVASLSTSAGAGIAAATGAVAGLAGARFGFGTGASAIGWGCNLGFGFGVSSVAPCTTMPGSSCGACADAVGVDARVAQVASSAMRDVDFKGRTNFISSPFSGLKTESANQ